VKEILDRAGIMAVRPEPVKVITMELIEAVEAEIARLEGRTRCQRFAGFR